MRRTAALVLMLVLAAPAWGEIVPRPGKTDSRVQTVDYDADDVVALRAPVGYQLTIELAADERIENVAVGDAGAWQVTANRRGDHLFVKPIQSGVRTNMVVVTDARTYAILLEPADAAGPDIPFTIRFRYPTASAILAPPAQPQEPGRYRLKGDRALRPGRIDDDGRSTTMNWPPDATQPAVFSVETSGQETLVNGHTVNGDLVVEGVASRYVFRLGKAVAQADRSPKAAR